MTSKARWSEPLVRTLPTLIKTSGSRLRRFLLLLSGLLFAITLSAMVFIEHVNEPMHWIPVGVCGLGMTCVAAALLCPRPTALLGLRAGMSVVVIGIGIGGFEHFMGNGAFHIETNQESTGFEAFQATLAARSSLLAPGLLALAALAAVVAVAATYRHPGLTETLQTAAAMDDYEAAMQSGDGVLKALISIDPKTQAGLEIGPLARPLVRKPNPIFYLDRLATEELRAYFAGQGFDPSTVVDVDFVCDEQHISESVKGLRFDYVLASHIVEHVPDLIGWLQGISTILRPQGVLSLIVPDRRYTFDILRRETTINEVLKAQGSKRPTPDQLYDHHAHYVDVDAAAIWMHGKPPDLKPANSQEHSRSLAHSAGYQDAHCWVFTPDSFVSIITGLNTLGLIDYDVRHVFPTAPGTNEFFVTITARE